ncbi:hypothetical protein BDW74DRAFT_187521 [Aspergillus multicolor]|uniref:uncharacterized protein n=1 Tax=Aspergillus multicolor TaxID=41759 RepID=UPI003CCDB92E
MDKDELWLSDEMGDEDDEGFTDPSAFTMALTFQGPPGEFRTRNKPGQLQRPTVSSFRAGSQKKPAFTVSCNAKAMVHGSMGGGSSKFATLLIYEFKFRSYRGARLKGADILFEFKPLPGATGRVSVAQVRPDGVHKMERTEQLEGHSVWAGITGAPMQAVGVEVGADRTVEKITAHHTVVSGDRPQDDWGDYYEARFALYENKSQADGIPSKFTACILLERDDDQDFVCVPNISVRPNFATAVATLFSSRDPDDPIYFSVDEPPVDLLEGAVEIDPTNLAATKLNETWDYIDLEDEPEPLAFHHIGPSPVKEPRKRSSKEIVKLLDIGEESWDALEDSEKLALAYRDPKNARPTFLHKMAENWANGEFRDLSMEVRRQIVLFLLDQRMPHKDGQDDSILTVAMNYNTADFIQLIIAHRPMLLPSLLVAMNVKKMNCLHTAFKDTLIGILRMLTLEGKEKSELLTSTMRTITMLLEFADISTITAKDADGNTPIHYAMDYRLCHITTEYKHEGRDRKYEDLIRLLLSKAEPAMKKPDVLFNARHYSPYRFYFYVKAGIASKSRKANASSLPRKETTTKAKAPVAEERREPKRGAAKPTAGEHLSRALFGGKEEPPQPAFSIKSNAHLSPKSLSKPLPKPLRDPQYPPGSSVVSTTGNKEIGFGEPSSGSLSRRATATLDAPVEEVQARSVSAAPKQTAPAKPERSKSGSTSHATAWPGGEEEKQAAANILAFVKCFFIRNSSDRDAKDLLYGKIASDKNLFFDASHLRGKQVDDVVRLIEKVSKAGGFEDTLSYVRIPQLASETQNILQSSKPNFANERRQVKRSSIDREPKGRDTLVKVFDKLITVNVRKILRLHVEDNADEWAHTDSAIEQAIRGFAQYSTTEKRREALDIGEWNWCKPDINLDVIRHAAPLVEHIHLHWSGNQTVLYGWASAENGIPFMSRNPRSLLSKVTIHAYQQDRLLGEQSEKPRSDAWIEAMERFRRTLMGMHRGELLREPRRVRVALIDDGIDLDEFNTYDNTTQYTGVSYCDEDAWWKSTEGHGTIMANMISRINPWVNLEVIKIQSRPSFIHGAGARSISPKSAADAINAAVMRKADIISMSWSITDLEYRMALFSENFSDVEGDKKPAVQSDLDLLKTAIKEAVKDDERLLICSAADDIRLIGDNTYPYNQAPVQILRIGSTGPLANRDPGSGSENSISYYLPGNQVAEEQRAHSSKPVVYHSGSSISTALATGLASLIMYCAHCLHSCGAGDKYEAWALALRDHANLRKAFDNINKYHAWDQDKKVVPVWGIFGNKGSQLEKASSGEDKIEVLKDIVTYLCHDVDLDKKGKKGETAG